MPNDGINMGVGGPTLKKRRRFRWERTKMKPPFAPMRGVGEGEKSKTLLQISLRSKNLDGYTKFKLNNFKELRQASPQPSR